jgi:hypothetical protein
MKYLVFIFILFSSVAMAALSPTEQRRYERMRIMVNEDVIVSLSGEKPIRANNYQRKKTKYIVESLNCKAMVRISYKSCDGQKRGQIWAGPKCFDIKAESIDYPKCKKVKSCTPLLKKDGKCW